MVKSNWLRRSVIIGLILAILNIPSLGLIGASAIWPLRITYLKISGSDYDFIYEFSKILTNCSGESCWGVIVIVSSIYIFLLTILIGYLVQRGVSKKV